MLPNESLFPEPGGSEEDRMRMLGIETSCDETAVAEALGRQHFAPYFEHLERIGKASPFWLGTPAPTA